MNFGQERYSWMEQDTYTGDKMPLLYDISHAEYAI